MAGGLNLTAPRKWEGPRSGALDCFVASFAMTTLRQSYVSGPVANAAFHAGLENAMQSIGA